MEVAKIGKGGQVNIPKDIRKFLELKPGHHLGFEIENNKVVLRPLNKTLLDYRGSIKSDGPQDLETIREEALSDWAEQRGKPHE